MLLRSQTADRTSISAVNRAITDSITGGPSQFPTMTPNGCFWLPKRQRKMIGVERLGLMGIVHYDVSLAEAKLCQPVFKTQFVVLSL